MRATAVLSVVLVALLPLAASQDPGQDITCSATKQCAVGCCGTYGICGMGPGSYFITIIGNDEANTKHRILRSWQLHQQLRSKVRV